MNTYRFCKRIAVATAAVLAVSASFTGCHSKIRSNVNVSSTASAVSSEADSAASEAVSSQAASAIILNTGSAGNSNTASKNGYSAQNYSVSKSVFGNGAKQTNSRISINNRNIVAPPIKKGSDGDSIIKRTTIEGVDGSFTDPNMNEKVVDLGGQTFTMATYWAGDWNGSSKTADSKRDAQVIKDIEKAYNCKIKIANYASDYLTQVTTARTSGKMLADILDVQADMSDLYRTGNLQDLLKVKSVGVQSRQWNPVYTLISSFKGGVYGVGQRYDRIEHDLMLFNKTLESKYNLGDLYSMASQGKWTDDIFLQVSQAFKKVNTDKTVFTCEGLYPQELLSMVYANWTSPFAITSSKYIFNGQDSTLLDILTFAQSYVKSGYYDTHSNSSCWQKDGTYKQVGSDAGYSIGAFETGKSLFFFGSDTILPGIIQSGKVKYGILPIPKGPASQGYSAVIRNCRYLSIINSNPNAETIGNLIVALANRTNIATGDVVQQNQAVVYDNQSLNQLTENYKYKQILNVEMNPCPNLQYIYYGAALKCVLKQEMTPKQAMDSIQTKAQTDINTAFGQS